MPVRVALVVVAPFQPADLRLAPRGGEGKFQDGQHRNLRALIATREVVAQLLEFSGSRPPRALARLADEAQLRARIACLLDDLRPHRKLPDALGGPQHDAGPDQVIRDRCGSCAFGAPRAHMIDQRGGRQGECVALAERVALQELEVSLFASLPLRNGFKGVDVPADELGERGCTVLNARERGRIFQGNLAVLWPS